MLVYHYELYLQTQKEKKEKNARISGPKKNQRGQKGFSKKKNQEKKKDNGLVLT